MLSRLRGAGKRRLAKCGGREINPGSRLLREVGCLKL